MRVWIDEHRCQGHTMCALAAPDVFTVDEDDQVAHVINEHVSAELEAAARAGMDSCPERAIHVEE